MYFFGGTFVRITRFCRRCFQRRFPEALALGLSFYQDKGKAVVGLRGSKQRRKQIARDKVCQVLIQYMEELNQCSIEDTTDCEVVTTCVDYCVQLENTELLFGRLWDLVSESESLKAAYLRALEPPLLDGSLVPRLPPLIAQHLVALYDQEERMESLQAIAVLLEVDCLDIHQVYRQTFFYISFRCTLYQTSLVLRVFFKFYFTTENFDKVPYTFSGVLNLCWNWPGQKKYKFWVFFKYIIGAFINFQLTKWKRNTRILRKKK